MQWPAELTSEQLGSSPLLLSILKSHPQACPPYLATPLDSLSHIRALEREREFEILNLPGSFRSSTLQNASVDSEQSVFPSSRILQVVWSWIEPFPNYWRDRYNWEDTLQFLLLLILIPSTLDQAFWKDWTTVTRIQFCNRITLDIISS